MRTPPPLSLYIPNPFSASLVIHVHVLLLRERKTEALIRLCGCTGWSARLLLECNKVMFFRVEVQLIIEWLKVAISEGSNESAHLLSLVRAFVKYRKVPFKRITPLYWRSSHYAVYARA